MTRPFPPGEVIPIDIEDLEEAFDVVQELKAGGYFEAMTEEQILDAIRQRDADGASFSPDLRGDRPMTIRGRKIAVIEPKARQ